MDENNTSAPSQGDDKLNPPSVNPNPVEQEESGGGGDEQGETVQGPPVNSSLPTSSPSGATAPAESAGATAVVAAMAPEDLAKLVLGLQDTVKKLSSDNEMLLSVADRGRIESYRGKKRIAPKSIVHVSKFGSQIVNAWRTLIDEVYQDSDSVWHEKQVIELTTEDGKKHIMPLLDRYRLVTKVPATVITRVRDNDGADGEDLHETFNLHLIDEDRDIKMDGMFIN